MDLFEAINNRRSIRKYKTDPVDEEKINRILEAGRWAPSWANTQCWRFIVVRDSQVKAKVAECLMPFKLPDGEMPNPAINILNTVPVVIVICAEMGKSGGPPGPAGGGGGEFMTDKGDWFMFDTALAVQNIREVMDVLKERGVDIAMDLTEIEQTAIAFIRDPTGNLIELFEQPNLFED